MVTCTYNLVCERSERLRWEDDWEIMASLGYRVRLHFLKKKCNKFIRQ